MFLNFGSFFKNIDYSNWRSLSPSELMRLLQEAHNKIVKDDETKKRFLKAVAALNKAFVLVAPHPEALKIKDDLAFFQILRKRVVKISATRAIPSPCVEFSPTKHPEVVELVMKQAQLLYKDWPIIHTMTEFEQRFFSAMLLQ